MSPGLAAPNLTQFARISATSSSSSAEDLYFCLLHLEWISRRNIGVFGLMERRYSDSE